MTDNLNIIKEALEAGIAIIDEPGVLLPYHKQKAIEKMCNALALIEKGEVMNITQIISSGGYSKVTLDNAERSDDERIGMAVVIPLEQEQSE